MRGCTTGGVLRLRSMLPRRLTPSMPRSVLLAGLQSVCARMMACAVPAPADPGRELFAAAATAAAATSCYNLQLLDSHTHQY